MGADCGGVDRHRWHVGVSEHCGDRGQRHAGGNGRDAECVPESSGARLDGSDTVHEGVLAALERGDAQLRRLEVHVAGSERERACV